MTGEKRGEDKLTNMEEQEFLIEGKKGMEWAPEIGDKRVAQDGQRRQVLENYLNPDSESYGDLEKSMVRAGYARGIAAGLSEEPPKWLKQVVRRVQIVEQSEEVLAQFTSAEYQMNDRIKADMARFALERLGRDTYGVKSKEEREEEKRIGLGEEGKALVEIMLKEYANKRLVSRGESHRGGEEDMGGKEGGGQGVS